MTLIQARGKPRNHYPPRISKGRSGRQVSREHRRIRLSIFQRDGFRCRWCGAGPLPSSRLHLDHVLAVVNGGTDDPTNLVTACAPCDQRRGDRE